MMTQEPDGTYAYTCEACGGQGILELPSPHTTTPFRCPEGCGALYVEYQSHPGVYTLKCVVQPAGDNNLQEAPSS
jgi:hypothetical protein